MQLRETKFRPFEIPTRLLQFSENDLLFVLGKIGKGAIQPERFHSQSFRNILQPLRSDPLMSRSALVLPIAKKRADQLSVKK